MSTKFTGRVQLVVEADYGAEACEKAQQQVRDTLDTHGWHVGIAIDDAESNEIDDEVEV